jgi:hypothetical protein
MLSFPSIDDPVRVALDAEVRHFSKYVGYANIAVAVGVALEGLELVYRAAKWAKKKIRKRRERAAHKAASRVFPVGELTYATEAHSEEPTWLKALLFIGLLGVVGGVVAEWQYGTKLEDAHNAVHRYDLGKITAADEKAGNAEKSAKGAAAASASAKLDAQAAKEALINLAVCNSPRVFSPWTVNGVRDNRFDPLNPFATQVIIDFIPDFEARRAALYLRWALDKRAGWTVVGFNQTSANDSVDEGVDVQTFVAPGSKEPKERDSQVQAQHRSENAADALVSFLRLHNWKADRGYPGDAKGRGFDASLNPPLGGLRIRIGLYPATVFVRPPGDKELIAAETKREQDRKDSLSAFLARNEEDRLKGLKGKARAELKAEIEQSRARSNALEQEYLEKNSNPCRTLDSVFPYHP